MNDNPLLALKALGQHVWLDNLSRKLLQEGALQRLMTEDGIDGVTSNPAIFQKAIAGSPCYREDLERLRGSKLAAEARYESLVIPDIQAACDVLLPAFVDSARRYRLCQPGSLARPGPRHGGHGSRRTAAARRRRARQPARQGAGHIGRCACLRAPDRGRYSRQRHPDLFAGTV